MRCFFSSSSISLFKLKTVRDTLECFDWRTMEKRFNDVIDKGHEHAFAEKPRVLTDDFMLACGHIQSVRRFMNAFALRANI